MVVLKESAGHFLIGFNKELSSLVFYGRLPAQARKVEARSRWVIGIGLIAIGPGDGFKLYIRGRAAKLDVLIDGFARLDEPRIGCAKRGRPIANLHLEL